MLEGLTIGEMAKECEVSRDTLRFYERERLLPPPRRSASGYRLYRREDTARLRFVHTVYFWAELARPFGELARVLRPGGRVVVAHRTDARAAHDFPPPIYRFPGDGAVRRALASAGLACEDAIHRALGHATISFQAARR